GRLARRKSGTIRELPETTAACARELTGFRNCRPAAATPGCHGHALGPAAIRAAPVTRQLASSVNIASTAAAIPSLRGAAVPPRLNSGASKNLTSLPTVTGTCLWKIRHMSGESVSTSSGLSSLRAISERLRVVLVERFRLSCWAVAPVLCEWPQL